MSWPCPWDHKILWCAPMSGKSHDHDHKDDSPLGTLTSEIHYENSGDEDVAMEPAVNAQPIIEDDPIDFPPFEFFIFSEDDRSLRWDFSVGRLMYNKRSRELTAICNDSRHTEFADCKNGDFASRTKTQIRGGRSAISWLGFSWGRGRWTMRVTNMLRGPHFAHSV